MVAIGDVEGIKVMQNDKKIIHKRLFAAAHKKPLKTRE